MCWGHNCFPQDFLETKFSINDIKTQRENFAREKIKSVTVKTKHSEKVFDIDSEGKIISENGKGDNPFTLTYNYQGQNLIGFTGPFAHSSFEYDKKGNVKILNEEQVSYKYFYDSQNRIVKQDVEADFETCPFDKTIYNGLFMTEKIYPCCEGNYAMRVVYEYSDKNNISKIISYSKNCTNKSEYISDIQEYFYEGDSVFPVKIMENDTEETTLSYEYY